MSDPPADRIHLFDANAIIEAVRTGVWNALTGGLTIETVRECANECREGDTLSTGYVAVSDEQLDRLAATRNVSDVQRAAILLNDASSGLDPGERDLFAHALSLPADSQRMICSPDRASVRFAAAVECEDQLISLEETIGVVGARAAPPLRGHFTSRWLSVERTKARLGIP